MSSKQRQLYLKSLRIQRIQFERTVKDSIFILFGIMGAAFGLKGFLLPNNFLDGGVMGISLLTTLVTNIDLSLLVILLNLPFIIIGYTQISKVFAFKTLIAISGLALVLYFIDFSFGD